MKQTVLFSNETSGADFSNDGLYRYSLWRIWGTSKPLVMFIGLNPSTANETESDPTIKSVARISQFNGYGGFIMMNCWPYIATNPSDLQFDSRAEWWNNEIMKARSKQCRDIVFAWGNFKIVRDLGRDLELQQMFPHAKTIGLNKNGSPKHPLFQKGTSTLIDYDSKHKL